MQAEHLSIDQRESKKSPQKGDSYKIRQHDKVKRNKICEMKEDKHKLWRKTHIFELCTTHSRVCETCHESFAISSTNTRCYHAHLDKWVIEAIILDLNQ